MGHILVFTGKGDPDFADDNYAKIAYGTINKYLFANTRYTVPDTRRPITVKKLTSDVSVTIQNNTTEMFSIEISRPQRETLDDILKPGKKVTLPSFSTAVLRR